MSDTMYIRDLVVECIIGTNPEERTIKQKLVLNIEMDCNLRVAGISDDLEDAVNYNAVSQEIIETLEKSEFFLIEKTAAVVAEICRGQPGVRGVVVTVDKPGALECASSAAVRIER